MAATELATSNGQTAIVLPANVPATITVEVNGAKITAEAAVSSSGNIWFKAVQKGALPDEVSFEDAILSAEVSFEGEVLPLAKRNKDERGNAQVHVSQPRLYEKGHRLAGQKIPNTGGNTALSYYASLPTWGANGYNLRVTLSGVTNAAKQRFISVTVQAMGNAAPRGGMGHLDGDLSFG